MGGQTSFFDGQLVVVGCIIIKQHLDARYRLKRSSTDKIVRERREKKETSGSPISRAAHFSRGLVLINRARIIKFKLSLIRLYGSMYDMFYSFMYTFSKQASTSFISNLKEFKRKQFHHSTSLNTSHKPSCSEPSCSSWSCHHSFDPYLCSGWLHSLCLPLFPGLGSQPLSLQIHVLRRRLY